MNCPTCGQPTCQGAVNNYCPPITIVKAVQTCSACPSQWDAYDADGNYYYLRYRHGHGTVQRFPGPDFGDIDPADPRYSHGVLVRSFDYGHPMAGCMGLDEFATHANLKLEL